MSTPERTLVTEASADETYIRKDADPNSILVGGAEYQRSGLFQIAPRNITTSQVGRYVSDLIEFSLPTPPTGWRYAILRANSINAQYADVQLYGGAQTGDIRLVLVCPISVAAASWWGGTAGIAVPWILTKD